MLVLITAACGGDLDSSLSDAGARTSDDTPVDESSADDEPAQSSDAVDRSAELVGRWEVTNYELTGGGLTNVLGEDVHITYAADGAVSYGTGCNQGSSVYTTSGVYFVPESALDDTPEGQAIAIGPTFEQTEIGCDGFLGEQDADIPARLAEATRFRIDGDRLLLLDEFLLVEATRVG
jgi:heat shock protein HslJ